MLERLVTPSMSRLERASPFLDWQGASRERLRLAPRLGLGVFEIAAFGYGELAAQRVADGIGLALPGPNAVAETAGVAALSTGPNRWLIVAPEAMIATLPNRVDAELAAVTDLSHGRAVITLSGPDAAPTLMQGTGVDLEPALFPVGSAAATALPHIPVVIWRRAEGYDVIIPRSYAQHLLEWLLEAGGLTA
jgi:sarcosine oxidase subunit gamma